MKKNVPHRLYLTEEQMPKQWYNLRADMKEQPAPIIYPATGKHAAMEDLYPVFCEELAKQEMDFVSTISILPALQSAIIRLNSSRARP